MNRNQFRKSRVGAFKHANGRCVATGYTCDSATALPSRKGNQGQIVGAIQITPRMPIPSAVTVRVDDLLICA